MIRRVRGIPGVIPGYHLAALCRLPWPALNAQWVGPRLGGPSLLRVLWSPDGGIQSALGPHVHTALNERAHRAHRTLSGGGSGPGAWGECSCPCGGMSVGGGDARVRPLLFSLHAHPAGSDLCPSGEILVACAVRER